MFISPANIRTFVTHLNCADGIMSARVLEECAIDLGLSIPNVVFIVQDDTQYLEAREGLVFCDVCPNTPEEAARFAAVGAHVWDHHVSKRDRVAQFGARGVYVDEPGISGCVIASRLLVGNLSRQTIEMCRLVGIYDTWQTHHADWRTAQETVEEIRLRGYPVEDSVGCALVRRRAERAKRALRTAHCTLVKGVQVMIVNFNDMTGINALPHKPDKYLMLGYMLDPNMDLIKVSMRARHVDVSSVCRKLGGGGHPGAGGFFAPLPSTSVLDWLISLAEDAISG